MLSDDYPYDDNEAGLEAELDEATLTKIEQDFKAWQAFEQATNTEFSEQHLVWLAAQADTLLWGEECTREYKLEDFGFSA